MKKYLIIAASFIFLLSLTGCFFKRSSTEVKKFIKKEYGLTDFEVSSKPEIFKDYNGYSDEIWEVRSNDKWDTCFEVFVDKTHSTSGKGKIISGNYYDKILEMVLDDYSFNKLRVVEDDYEGFYTIKLMGDFTTKDDLKTLFDDVEDLRMALISDDLEIDFDVRFCMETPIRNSVKDQPDGSEGYIYEDGDFKGSFSTKKNNTKLSGGYSDAVSKLVKVALDYQFEENLEGMSEEEISEILENEGRRIGIIRNDVGDIEYYDDMDASWLGYGISFGSLYRVLVNEGFDVDGNCWHYSFEGVDGNTYEISYDFVDELEYREGMQLGYYYLVNGEACPMDFYFYNHFSQKKVEEMTGLKLEW